MRRKYFLHKSVVRVCLIAIGMISLLISSPDTLSQESIQVFLPAIVKGGVVREMLAKVSLDRSLADIKRLTGEEPICVNNECYTINNRLTGSEGLRWAKGYVYSELTRLGYFVTYHNWSRNQYSDQNIVARKPGVTVPGEEIYMVAHLDGVKPDPMKPAPGADDNASGVVDLLELARVLSGYSLDRTIVLLFTTGEEQGTLGVQSYLDGLTSSEISAIKYAVNIDVIGYDANQDNVMELWHGNDPPSYDLVTRINGYIRMYQLNLNPVYVIGCG